MASFKELTPSPIVLIVLFSTTIYFIYKLYYPSILLRARGLSLPPGPQRRWITGNLHQIQNLGDKAMEWSKTYGPIVYIQIFDKKIIFLNSAKVALDLLDGRSKIYSERPIEYMANLCGRNLALFSTSMSDPRFKILRKLLQDGLNPRAVKTYRPIQIEENRVLLAALANQPEDFRAHIRRNAVALIMKAAYGYQVEGNDDYVVRIIEEAFEQLADISTPGRFLVDFFPFLRFLPSWFPLAGFKRYAEAAKRKLSRLENVPFEWAQENISSGNFVNSFVSSHLSKENGQVPSPDEQEYIKWASSALFAGAGDTTVATLSAFFLAMTLYPEVQKRAQKHIKQSVPNRLPTVDDYDSLPYIRVLLRELMRWAPAVPLGLRHCVLQDDVYENYFIPKGATIIGNIGAIVHDEEIYPNPYDFDPSRYLGNNPQPDPYNFIFGFGRRTCPGSHFSEMSLFLNITTILAVFDISKAVDQEGNEIQPKVEWIHGITSHPVAFDCQIKPRSEECLAMLEQVEV